MGKHAVGGHAVGGHAPKEDLEQLSRNAGSCPVFIKAGRTLITPNRCEKPCHGMVYSEPQLIAFCMLARHQA